jgi:hypothetical protein
LDAIAIAAGGRLLDLTGHDADFIGSIARRGGAVIVVSGKQNDTDI